MRTARVTRQGRLWIRSTAGRSCPLIVLVAVFALLAGCSAEPGDTDGGGSTASTISPDSTSTDTTAPADASTTSETAATSTTAGTTATSSPSGALVLRSDGLGVLKFGEPVDTALPLLIGAAGEPSGDSTTTGVMPQGFGGTAVRFVQFGRLHLGVTFSDGAYFRDDGVMHFASWWVGPDSTGLATPEGITVGSTVDQLRAAFGDQLRLDSEPSECDGRWHFGVGPSALGIEGVLSGSPTDGSSFVTGLSAGAQSEC